MARIAAAGGVSLTDFSSVLGTVVASAGRTFDVAALITVSEAAAVAAAIALVLKAAVAGDGVFFVSSFLISFFVLGDVLERLELGFGRDRGRDVSALGPLDKNADLLLELVSGSDRPLSSLDTFRLFQAGGFALGDFWGFAFILGEFLAGWNGDAFLGEGPVGTIIMLESTKCFSGCRLLSGDVS